MKGTGRAESSSASERSGPWSSPSSKGESKTLHPSSSGHAPFSYSTRYNARFLGMLEDPADGLGAWSLQDATLAGMVVNATFPSFLKLCE